MPPIDSQSIQAVMKKAHIPGVSIASVNANGMVSSTVFGTTNAQSEPLADVTPETRFGAASLSKPVFAYLVLKLIEANATGTAFDLDTPLHHILRLDELHIEGVKPFDPECGLLAIPLLPTPDESRQYATSQYILTDSGLFYYSKINDELSSIKLNESQLETLRARFSDNKSIDKLSGSEYCDITSITGHNALTARMVLSHQTGLKHGELKFQFEPNDGHGYSNMAILYLQKIIEKLTATNLEVLAKKHVFDPLQMNYSRFIANKSQPSETYATNGLKTTASDYARFVSAWMHDDALQEAFVPQVFMTEDKGKTGAIGIAKGSIPDADLEHVAWGLGLGLQTDANGKVTTAYHSGDMNESRAWVAMNLEDKTATVYFANAHNGHVLAEQIIPPTIKLEHASNYFFPKWGFAKNVDELEPGCYARIILSEPGTQEKNKVISRHEILIIRTGNHYEIGFCNQKGEYEQTPIHDKETCDFLSTYPSGSMINTPKHIDKLNKILTSLESITLKPNWQEKPNWGLKRQMPEMVNKTVLETEVTEKNPLLDEAREVMQHYRSAIKEVTPTEGRPSTSIEETEEHSAPSPFQTKPKPASEV